MNKRRILFPIITMLFMMQVPHSYTETQADPSIQAAIQNLNDPDQKTRWRAARYIREYGPEAVAAIPALIQAANEDSSLDVQAEALFALGSIGRASTEAVKALIEFLNTKYSRISPYAIWALGYAGPNARDSVDALIKYLESTSSNERICDAIKTLGMIGPSAKRALPVIEKHLNNNDYVPERGSVAATAKEAIRRIRTE